MKPLALIPCLLALASCTTTSHRTGDYLVPRAAQFMQSYAQDLSQGDKASIAARYHPQGIYFLGNGRKLFRTYEDVATIYRNHWNAPASFEWQDLSYEQVGSAAVLVLGKFKWIGQDGKATISSYSSLLEMVDGQLKIRSEDESSAQK